MADIERYFDLGFKCFPAHVWMKKMPDGSFDKCFIFGRKDTQYAGWRRCTHTLETLKVRWKDLEAMDRPVNTICIETGKTSGCTVVDRDSNPKSTELLKQLAPEIYDAPHDSTPGKGNHFYFQYSPGARTLANPAIGIDVRNDGGLIIMPPSRNARGVYNWEKPIISRVDMPEFPVALFGYLFGSGARQKQITQETTRERPSLQELEGMLCIMPRYGYDDWLKIISSLWTAYSYEETEGMLKRWMPEEKPGEYEYKYSKRILEGLSLGTFFYYYREARRDWSPMGQKPPEPVKEPLITRKAPEVAPDPNALPKGDPDAFYHTSRGTELTREEFIAGLNPYGLWATYP